MALRECRTVHELYATYREVHERLWNGPCVARKAPPIEAPAPPPPPQPPPPAAPRRPRRVQVPGQPPLLIADIARIQHVVAEHFDIEAEAMWSVDRSHAVIQPRFIAVALSRSMTRATTTQIARKFHRDHSTIISTLQKMGRCTSTDPGLLATVVVLRQRILDCFSFEPEVSHDDDARHGTAIEQSRQSY